MSDMDDTNEPTDATEHWLGPQGRRAFLTKAAAAGAIAWAAPVILSRAAYAVEGGEGTPKCRPTIKVCCTRYFCVGQGGGQSKYFPGLSVVASNCPCSSGTCASACVKIVNITSSSGASVSAYGPGTTCGPLSQGGSDVGNVFSDGSWHCLTAAMSTIFFGKTRQGNGAIGDIGSDTITFDMAVWASCPDRTPQNGPASTCTTHRYSVMLGNGNTPVCHCDTPTPPAVSLCGGANFSPCPSCGPESGCTANPGCPTSVNDPTPIAGTPITCPS
jgi:hypothetical protein